MLPHINFSQPSEQLLKSEIRALANIYKKINYTPVLSEFDYITSFLIKRAIVKWLTTDAISWMITAGNKPNQPALNVDDNDLI